jgi:general secretion pathway protein D
MLVKLTLDPSSSSIIVTSPLASKVREVMAFLKKMDRKRQQVLIEMIVVSADVSDEQQLGVEWWRNQPDGRERFLGQLFSIAPTTGVLDSANPHTLNVGDTLTPGMNAVLLNSEDYNIAVRALATTRKAEVIASPRLLVQDGTEGTLRSISEQPFTSLNAGQTVSTTSFAGFAEAGPQITVKPRLTESGSIYLDYTIIVSNFTGPPPNAQSPPPRKTDRLHSNILVPDSHTVIVGGLNFDREQADENKVPFLGDVPLLGELFKRSQTVKTKTRLFVFIHPIVVRDDQFLELKSATAHAAAEARIDPGVPMANPVRIMKK